MKDSGSGQNSSGNVTNTSQSSSVYDNLTVMGSVIVGTVVFTYLSTKYEQSAKEFLKWLTGKSSARSRRRRNRRLRNHPRGRNRFNNNSRNFTLETIEEDESHSNFNLQPNRRNNGKLYRGNNMFYITEENTVSDTSSLCEDIIYPVGDNETSITYSHRGRGHYYLDANDELVDAEDDQIIPEHCYLPEQPKDKITHRLYRKRELEAMKFVDAVDDAINQFKKLKIDHFENKLGAYQDLKGGTSKAFK